MVDLRPVYLSVLPDGFSSEGGRELSLVRVSFVRGRSRGRVVVVALENCRGTGKIAFEAVAARLYHH